MARAQHQLLDRMAEHHAKEGQPRRRRRPQGRRGQIRQIFHAGRRRGRLTSWNYCGFARILSQPPKRCHTAEKQGTNMRHLTCVALALGLASPAFAQNQPSAAELPGAEEIANKDTVTVALGGALTPDYEGADEQRVILAAAIRGKVSGISFSTRGTYLYVDVIPQSSSFDFDAGPIV